MFVYTCLAISVAVILKLTQTLGELLGKWRKNLEQEELIQLYNKSLRETAGVLSIWSII